MGNCSSEMLSNASRVRHPAHNNNHLVNRNTWLYVRVFLSNYLELYYSWFKKKL